MKFNIWVFQGIQRPSASVIQSHSHSPSSYGMQHVADTTAAQMITPQMAMTLKRTVKLKWVNELREMNLLHYFESDKPKLSWRNHLLWFRQIDVSWNSASIVTKEDCRINVLNSAKTSFLHVAVISERYFGLQVLRSNARWSSIWLKKSSRIEDKHKTPK